MVSRGIVVTPRFIVDGTSLRFPGSIGIEPDDLRFYLLYWDRIDYPNSNIIHITSSPSEQFLIDESVMTRTSVAIRGSGRLEKAYVSAQLEALRLLNTMDPGKWSLAQTSNAFYLPSNKSIEKRSLEVELYSLLPVPTKNVALEDILIFKENRHDELQRLRIAMDELYHYIDMAKDVPRAKNAAILKLEKTLEDLNRVALESWTTRLLHSLRIEVNLPNLIKSSIKGEIVSQSFGLSPGIGAITGATASVIKFSIRNKRLPDELMDFLYLNHITDDFPT